MGTKHTKGEWSTTQVLSNLVIKCTDKYSTEDICTLKSKNKLEETQANAKLIASAPELLEALIKADKLLRKRCLDTDREMLELDLKSIISEATE